MKTVRICSGRGPTLESLRHHARPLPQLPRPAADAMPQLRQSFAKKFPAARPFEDLDISNPSLIDEIERAGISRASAADVGAGQLV